MERLKIFLNSKIFLTFKILNNGYKNQTPHRISDTFLADWHSDDTEIGIIIKDNKSGKWYYELLSMKGEVVEKTELSPEESNIRQYYMTSPRTALCLTDENTIRTCVLGNFSECR